MAEHRSYIRGLVKALDGMHSDRELSCDCGNEDSVIEWYRKQRSQVEPGSIKAHALKIAAQVPVKHTKGCRHRE